ncbi:hypothetical protein A3B32_03280 [Candidatus Uhrbacteria bacterium RIFCSPLOWO2_01_FULL_53_9]|uniref:Uncharacterized protein n=3 Tax=Candidatus Uhriibacteriota TaxID=1752732 RepID=A0A1F7UYG1_9BACT|nr:MAG: hypothetical protein A3C17_03680 [Candidatus Uhrbacteria bacterium RIFCSPHIGHO2_02_FULL_53_13]OGL83309.1 MAG: hypothetical protein A3B32_03280 [Candidatus Uhrbacteria bacterium RIFCSPLOWO2_01_FULL_53_9]OGL90182.1 MAG: hypothetical protein A3I45_02380 [Candidatus Uhrbacteria bacterium RIFCSPLOWO2_02_FULL_53_10]
MTKKQRILLWVLWPIALLALSLLLGYVLVPIAGTRASDQNSLRQLIGFDGINKALFLAWVLPLVISLLAAPLSWGYAIYIAIKK